MLADPWDYKLMERCVKRNSHKFFFAQHFVRSQFSDPLKMDFVMYYMIMILWNVGRSLGLQSNGEMCLSEIATKFALPKDK